MRLKDVTISANTGLDAIKRAPIVEYNTGLKCIRIQDISQGKDYDDWGDTEISEKDYEQFRLKRNDLLVARTGATVGVSYLVKKDYMINNLIDAFSKILLIGVSVIANQSFLLSK